MKTSQLPKTKLFAVALVSMTLVACTKSTLDDEESLSSLPNCDVENIQQYLGMEYNDGMESDLKAEADAEEVRVLGPKSPATKDYRHERLSISVDEEGLIVSMGCG